MGVFLEEITKNFQTPCPEPVEGVPEPVEGSISKFQINNKLQSPNSKSQKVFDFSILYLTCCVKAYLFEY